MTYPKEWKKVKNHRTGWIEWVRNTKRGNQTVYTEDWINGYKYAMKDIKMLNK